MLDSRWHWIWILAALVFFVGLVGTLPAEGAPKPNYAARLTANFHLQIQVSDVDVPDVLPGDCRVTGTVVRLFRARSDTLDTGERLEVPVYCTITDEIDIDDDITAVSELQDAKFIEMYVNPLPDAGFELSKQQFMVIKAPSDQPQCETERAGIMC